MRISKDPDDYRSTPSLQMVRRRDRSLQTAARLMGMSAGIVWIVRQAIDQL